MLAAHIISVAAVAQTGRLLVGSMPLSEYSSLSLLPLPAASNQKFCTAVRLAPTVLAWAYVPTAAERGGNFAAFSGRLVDPATNAPFPGGIIPASRLPAVFAWRLATSRPAPGEPCLNPPAPPPTFSTAFYITGLDVDRDRLVLSENSFSTSYQIGQPNPADQTLTIDSAGVPLEFEISPPRDTFTQQTATWLTVQRPAGCCVTPSQVRLRFQPFGLIPNPYEAAFTVTPIGAIGSPRVVIARVSVSAPASHVTVDQTRVLVQYNVGSSTPPEPVTIRITSLGSAQNFVVQLEIVTPPFTTPSAPVWLSVSPLGGNSPTDLTVTFDASELRALGRGTYLALIRIFAPGAPNSPVTIAILAQVVPPPDFTFTVPDGGLEFTYTPGAPAPQPLRLGLDPANEAIRQVKFDVWPTCQKPVNGTWLQVTPVSTNIPGTVMVSLDTAAASALPPDRYDGFVNISAGTATGEEVPVTLIVSPGSGSPSTQVLAHIADGLRWKTTIILVNTDQTASATATLRFWPGQDTPPGSILAFDGLGPAPNNTLTVSVPAGGSATLRTIGSTGPPLWQGWAEVEAPPTVGGTAIFRSEYSASQDAEGAVLLKYPAGQRMLLAFDNTTVGQGAYDTGFAIVNTSATQSANVTVVVRDQNGDVRLPNPPVLQLQPREHRAFELRRVFETTQQSSGVAEFISDGPEIAGLGLRFNPSGVFTSFETLTTPPAGVRRLAHIADGQSWRTSLILVNPSNTDGTTAAVRFHPGKDTPANTELPLAGGATTIGGAVTVTLPPAGSTTIRTRGDTGGLLWQGWAEVSSTAPVTGFAVFRAQLSAEQEIEGTVPLVSGTGSRVLLPVEHNAPAMVTSLAVANVAVGQVTADLWAADGTPVLQNRQLNFAGHTALDLTEAPFGLSSANGVLQFSATGGQIIGLGLRFNNARRAFTSLPVLIR
jgi:hypothetical protein